MERFKKTNSCSEGLNKRSLEDCGGGQLSKYRKVFFEYFIVTLTNVGLRTIQLTVATYEQTKTGLSYFYPEVIVKDDWIHTKPLLFQIITQNAAFFKQSNQILIIYCDFLHRSKSQQYPGVVNYLQSS